jgi:hypothetical protein
LLNGTLIGSALTNAGSITSSDTILVTHIN